MPASPSLLIVPARFKTGKLYTQIATTSAGLVLGSSGDFNVTRATTATRFNSAGLIESVASGVPRLDYFTSGGTAGCPALLVEPQSQNVVVQSQNWLASGWRDDATSNVTTVSSTTGTIDPLGTNTANAISPTSGNTTHLKVGSDASIGFTSGTIYTSSAFFKQGTGNAGRYVQVTFPTVQFGQLGYANFDLQLGTVAVVSGTSADANRAASVENYGNGWYRCRLTSTCNASGTSNGISIALIETSGATRLPTFTGTTTNVIYGWGAQTETGSIATSYIPTTAAPVTRNADVISLSGAVSGCIGQTEGTIYAEFEYRTDTSTRRILALSDGSQSNRVMLIFAAGSVFAQINAQSISIGTPVVGYNKAAFGYIQNGVSGTLTASLNGGAVVSGTSAAYPASLNTINVGKIEDTATTSQINSRIRSAAIYTSRLSNAELIALSTL
jgi:hypothetical protein